MNTSAPVTTIDVTRISRLLRYVDFANYFMLVAGGIEALAFLTKGLAMATAAHSPAQAIFALVGAILYGVVAWIGWTNISILGAVIHDNTRPGLLLMLLLSGFTGAFSWIDLQNAGWPEDGDIRPLTVGVMGATAALAGLIAVTVLRRLSIAGLQLGLRAFLTRTLAVHAEAKNLPPANRVKGISFLALGIAWLVAMTFIPESLIPRSIRKSAWQGESYLAQIGWAFLIYARHYFRPDFKHLRASDPRPPVIFLRSFQDDEQVNYRQADSSLFDFSLESRLSDHFSHFGPFIAVGKPGDKLPHLGAARASLSDDEWQGTVRGWITDAQLIIVMIGRTHWVDWELQRIIEMGQVGKLIVVFPQIKRFTWRDPPSAEERLAVIRGAFAGTPWAAAIAAITASPGNIRSLVFGPGGTLTLTTSRSRTRDSYHLATLIAYDVQTRIAGQGPAAPAALPEPQTRKRKNVLRAALAVGFIVVMAGGTKLTRQDLATMEPLPPDVPVTSHGKLAVGNFAYLNPDGTPGHLGTFHPGETVSFIYNVGGVERDDAGRANVTADTILRAFDDSHADLRHVVFDQAMGATNLIKFSLSLPLLISVQTGTYSFDISLYDSIGNSDLRFQPTFHVVPAGQ